MAAFAVNEIAALQLLRKCGTNSRAACAARFRRNRRDSDALTLFEDAMELALQTFRERRLDLLRFLFQHAGFAAKIAE